MLVLFVVSWMANENFMTKSNLTNVSVQIAVGTILAFGQTILIISGMLDLSSASVLALAGVFINISLLIDRLVDYRFLGGSFSKCCLQHVKMDLW